MKKLTYAWVLLLNIFSYAQSKKKIPFTGKRDFNMEENTNGSGTPAYYLDVKRNGNVHFGLIRINQANGEKAAVLLWKLSQ